MRQYELLEAMTFKHGRFKLTTEQFANRRYVTKVIDKDELVVEPISDISFKRGEIVTTDLEIPRAIERKLRPLDADQSNPQQPVLDIKSEGVATDPLAGDIDPLADLDDSPPVAADPEPVQKPGRRARQ